MKIHHSIAPHCVKQTLAGAALAVGLLALAAPAAAVPYQVKMDAVDNLANWSTVDNGIGDLYDSTSTKQVDVTYRIRSGFGNTAALATDPQFWNSLEYGNRHRAIFGPLGGVDVVDVEIAGLNGNLISLSQVVMGRWYPDGINTLGSDWRVYDDAWNLLASGNTVMTDFVDYTVGFSLGTYSTLRFQFGDDNWDNGIIAFTYTSDILGSLDMRLDRNDAPTVPPPNPNPVPAPSSLLLALAALGALRAVTRARV